MLNFIKKDTYRQFLITTTIAVFCFISSFGQAVAYYNKNGELIATQSSSAVNPTTIVDKTDNPTLTLDSVSNFDILNPTGNPVGGGLGYNDIVNDGKFTAKNKSELITAIEAASDGDVIFIPRTAVINLTGPSITISKSITIASDRGNGGSLGALLYSTNGIDANFPYRTIAGNIFYITGNNVRITGLRIKGPTARSDTPKCDRYYPVAIKVSGFGERQIKIDNNEMYNWPYATVDVFGGSTDTQISHNHIHHNRRYEKRTDCGHGLGYGVVLDKSHVIIEANHFNHNRHDIAGTGRGNSGYRAEYNISTRGTDHAFDMHGCKDNSRRSDCKNPVYVTNNCDVNPNNPLCNGVELHTDRAGNDIQISNNLFLDKKNEGVNIRGFPETQALIKNNKFVRNKTKSFLQTPDFHLNLGKNIVRHTNYFDVKESTFYSQETIDFKQHTNPLIGDFNGDNIDDYLYRGLCGTSPCWRMQKWVYDKQNQHTRLVTYNWGNQIGTTSNSKDLGMFVGDFNKDGMDDIGYYAKCGSTSFPCWKIHKSTGFSLLAAKDFGNGAWFSSLTKIHGIQVGDFNGDNYSDIAYVGKCGKGETCIRTQFSNGSEFSNATPIKNLRLSGNTAYQYRIKVLDLNDDGIDDIGYKAASCGTGLLGWYYHEGNESNEFTSQCLTEDLF